MLEKIHDILHAWFGENDDQLNQKQWLEPDNKFVNHLKKEFEPVLAHAHNGELDLWLQHATSTLAYVLLHDQFPRLFYPNQAQALAYDQKARQATKHALERELEKDLSLIEQSFLWMPLVHSEDLNDQKMSLALYNKLVEEAQASKKDSDCILWLETAREKAIEHHEIILKFDRFPQHNNLLNRESTDLELKFLQIDH